MSEIDVIYYQRRAMTERLLAVSASNADVAAIHLDLATRYQGIVEEAQALETLAAINRPSFLWA